MKKSVLLFTLLTGAAAAAPAAWGAHLSFEQALARVQSGRHQAPALNASEGLKLTASVGNLYVFSGSAGYLVLPNDDAAPALLGYSDGSAFDAEHNPNLAYWLESLSAEIDYLTAGQQSAPAKIDRPARAAIAPMVATRWNQESPYNDDCPTVNGTRCVTGCVATAMAQVLKYHNHPAQGTGQESYPWKYRLQGVEYEQKLSFDYGATTFNWDAMTNQYDASSTEESKAAVAELMYACGVGVHMGYGTGASSASSMSIPSAIINHFGYDKAAWVASRDAYGLDEWEEMIYNELKENRPVLYGGQGSGGGHEFVCDGYSRDGFFHFNWGWGGMSDGYFLLSALNPGNLGTGGGAGGYNFQQDAVMGVQPAKEGSEYTYVMYNFNSDFKADSESATLGSRVTFLGGFINSSAETIENFHYGIKIRRDSDNEVRYAESGRYASLPPSNYYDGFTVTIPADLAAGEYTITPAFRVEGHEWQEMRTYIAYTGYLNATVENNTITFSQPQKSTVTVTDITTMSELYIGRLTPLSYTVSNPGDTEYLGSVTPCLLDADDELVAIGETIPVDLLGGESKAYEEIATSFNRLQGAEFTAGTYKLVFRDADKKLVSDKVEVEVKDNPGTASVGVTEFNLVTETPVRNKKSVKFDVGVQCSTGYFTGTLRVVIFPYRPGESVSSVHSGDTPVFYLTEGESETKTADLNLYNLENGRYFAMLYLGSNHASDKQIIFELKHVSTGIDEVEVETDEPELIYDLNGLRHTRPLAPGLYIINGHKTVVK
ncbi:MAG: C10 family peptidase [Muribaculaceae bacterium]|nr:C10 family peptidase [Muribaculaceae bacterium]